MVGGSTWDFEKKGKDGSVGRLDLLLCEVGGKKSVGGYGGLRICVTASLWCIAGAFLTTSMIFFPLYPLCGYTAVSLGVTSN